MLLRLFRVNDPYRLLGIFALLVAFSLWFFIDPADLTLNELKSIVLGESLNDGKTLYAELFTSTPPLTAWFFEWIDFIFGRSLQARHIISLLIIFFQGSFFAIVLINNKAQNENTYLPALIFGVLCLFSFDMLSLSGELLASTFLLFALNNLFKEVEFRIQQDSTLLNLGIYLGIASLFVFSYSIFLPGTLVILMIFTRATVRKILLLVYGFILPHLLLMTFYFTKGDFNFVWTNFYQGNEWRADNFISLWSLVCLSATPIIYFLFSLVMVNREAHLTKYQSQLLQIMFLWLGVAMLEITLAGKMTPARVITFIPPLAYFTSHYLLLIRRKWIGEIMLWMFVGGIVTTSQLARYGKINAIEYGGLSITESNYRNQIKGKKILVLGTDWGLFKENKLASYFYDWSLSKNYFENPDYFENVVLIDQSLVLDAPQIIVDTKNLMEKIMVRNPKLMSKYERAGDLYILK
ncbi:MAG: hypothetical protein JNM78_15565 [Cyclobacteriaceae bacterium]|nr:hypothetical protein [Cyclobacteriaceae bacterium]